LIIYRFQKKEDSMPIVDMPLEQLKKYKGVNPRPADFDEYWDRGLKEMHSLDPEVKLVQRESRANFVECFDLYFTGLGGARIYAKYLRPKKSPGKHPAVVMLHGYSGNSGEWVDKYGYAAQGYSFFALDCRGQGGKSEDTGRVKGTTFNGHIVRGLDDAPEKLLFRSIFLDCAQLAGIAMKMEEVDPSRVGAFGFSQGGGLTLACAALEPRIKRAAPVYPFLCDYKRVWDMDLAVSAYAELKTHFRLFDPKHQREEEIFTRLGYIDAQYLAPRIKAEIFMGTGLMDTVCPPSTQFAAYNKITSKKNVCIYPDFGHEGLPGFNDAIFEFMCGL